MQKSRGIIFSIWIVLFVQTLGCTSLQRTGRSSGPKKSQPEVSTFDSSDGGVAAENESEDRELQDPPVRPEEISVPKVGVILGPGMALSFAHAGVLKSFDDSKIPVEHIVGMGWGAVVGALYSKQGMANDAQWRIYKLKQGDLPGKSFFSSAITAESVSSMNSFLTDGLQKDVINKSKIPFACPTMSLKNGKTYWQRRGRLVDAVSRCISFPPLFKPVSSTSVGDLFAFRQSVEYLRQRGMTLIIYVDVLHKGELLSQENLAENYPSFILWNEIRRLSLRSHAMMTEVITINTGPFRLTDFGKKQSLVKRGESEGQSAVRAIVKKYGF